MPEPTTVRDEMAAMKRIAAALDALNDLDPAARQRVTTWARSRYFPGDDTDPDGER